MRLAHQFLTDVYSVLRSQSQIVIHKNAIFWTRMTFVLQVCHTPADEHCVTEAILPQVICWKLTLVRWELLLCYQD